MLDLSSIVAIPDYARTDLAWEEQLQFGFNLNSFATYYTVPGEFFDVIKFHSITFTASAVVGTRTVVFQISDADNKVVYFNAYGPGITASQVLSAEVVAGNASAIGFTVAGQVFQQQALPVIVLWAGYKFQISISGQQAGDVLNVQRFRIIHIPTGPVFQPDTLEPMVTPVLL